MFVFLISFVRLWLACVGICIFKLAYLYLLISMFFFVLFFFFCLPHAFRQPLFFFIYLPHLHGYFLHPSTHFYKFPSFCRLSFVSFYLFLCFFTFLLSASRPYLIIFSIIKFSFVSFRCCLVFCSFLFKCVVQIFLHLFLHSVLLWSSATFFLGANCLFFHL